MVSSHPRFLYMLPANSTELFRQSFVAEYMLISGYYIVIFQDINLSLIAIFISLPKFDVNRIIDKGTSLVSLLASFRSTASLFTHVSA